MTLIAMDHVAKSYPTADGQERVVLQDFSMAVGDSSFVAIIGPNGCGKSTVLNLLAGVIGPDRGEVKIVVPHVGKPRVGYVWQDYRATLLPWLNAAENIAFPLRVVGRGLEERMASAERALERFGAGINPRQRCYELSGGQQQLLCILRSTVVAPDYLLFDEPLSSLDQPTSWTMTFRLEQLWMERSVPAIVVSHDVDVAIMLADEILMMGRNQGKIERSIKNSLPRPRNVRMLESSEHIRCRKEVIEFLFSQRAIRDATDTLEEFFPQLTSVVR